MTKPERDFSRPKFEIVLDDDRITYLVDGSEVSRDDYLAVAAGRQATALGDIANALYAKDGETLISGLRYICSSIDRLALVASGEPPSSTIGGGSAPRSGDRRVREFADVDLERLHTLLAIWHAAFGDRPRRLVAVLAAAIGNDTLQGALVALCEGELDAHRLGCVFRRWHDRVVGGFVLRRVRGRANTARWRVEPA